LQLFNRKNNARNLVEALSHSDIVCAAEYSMVDKRGRVDEDGMATRGEDRENGEAGGYNTYPVGKRRVCLVGTSIVCIEGGDEAGR
jgi:hypothetical protein